MDEGFPGYPLSNQRSILCAVSSFLGILGLSLQGARAVSCKIYHSRPTGYAGGPLNLRSTYTEIGGQTGQSDSSFKFRAFTWSWSGGDSILLAALAIALVHLGRLF